MARHRPLIGITGPDRGGTAAWLATALAVWCAGGRPLRVTPRRPHAHRHLDGLIVGGGADVAPELYGEDEATDLEGAVSASSRHWTRRVLTLALLPLLWSLRLVFRSGHRIARDDARDGLETALIDEADARNLPVLGICRGAQLINVRRGGTLHRDLAGFYMESTQVTTLLPYKPVAVLEDSRLAAILRRGRCRVNSLHRQAVREPGERLQVAACEDNGVVQAIEDPVRAFLIGVQWHPEYLPQRPEQRRLFSALVRAARERGRSDRNG